MSDVKLVLWAVAAAFVAAIIIRFLPWPKGPNETLGDEADLDPPRPVGKHPALGAVYRQGPMLHYGGTSITLTPRQLEHINIWRRRDGKYPMSVAGFRAAIADQARTGASPIHSNDEWLTYLISASNSEIPEHHSFRVAVDTSIDIQTDMPFYGQFGGAGRVS